jgi:DNA-binding CsgD family transcriptional regulator
MSAVYFVRRRDGTGPIKIGMSSQVERRIKQLEIDHKVKLTVLAQAEGGFRDELRMHHMLADHRLEGEWFAPSAAVLSVIDQITRDGALPPPTEQDRDAIIERRYLGGETLQQIADDLGLTRERVRQLLRSNGVPSLGHRPPHKRAAAPISDFEREVADLYATGEWSRSRLKEEFGLSGSRLQIILKRTGAKTFGVSHFNTKEGDGERTEAVARLYRDGMTCAEIADTVGLGHQTHVFRYLKKAGIKPSRLKATAQDRFESNAGAIVARYLNGEGAKNLGVEFRIDPKALRNELAKRGVLRTRAENEPLRLAAAARAKAAMAHPLPAVPTTADPAGLDSAPMTAGGELSKTGASALSAPCDGASAAGPVPSHTSGTGGNVQQGAR